MLLHPGVQSEIVQDSPFAAGTVSYYFGVQTDAVLLALSVPAVSGSILVSLYAIASVSETLILQFPLITVPPGELLLLTSPTSTTAHRLEITYTAACTYSVHARAVTDDGSGGGSATDHHSGYYYIPAATTITVVENKQMTNFGGLIDDGVLLIDGQLILEP